MNEPDYGFVIRNNKGEYLCRRSYHRPYSKGLAHAKIFDKQKDVEIAASRIKGTIVLVELTEIMEFIEDEGEDNNV